MTRGFILCACLFQAVLLKSREQVADELSRLQRDNESLQGKHRLHLELQQQEDFQMPTTVQVRAASAPSITLQWYLLKCVWKEASKDQFKV